MTTNDNRKIKLYMTGDTTKDWRKNLSRIMSSQTGRKGATKLFNLGSDTDVKTDIDLIMAEAPKSPSTNNSYSAPVKTFTDSLSKNSVVNLISSVATYGINMISAYNDVFSENGQETGRTAEIFQPWTTNVKAWSGDKSTGISFKYTFKFSMGQYGLWNAREEVVKPIFNLIAPAFPQYISNIGMAGPFPSTAELLMRLFTGESLSAVSTGFSEGIDAVTNVWTTTTKTKDDKGVETSTTKLNSSDEIGSNLSDISDKIMQSLESIASALSTVVTASYANLTYTIQFGNMFKFENMLITDASTTFSNEVDQNGYPVSGTAELTFVGLVPLALKNNASFGKSQMFPNQSSLGGWQSR